MHPSPRHQNLSEIRRKRLEYFSKQNLNKSHVQTAESNHFDVGTNANGIKTSAIESKVLPNESRKIVTLQSSAVDDNVRSISTLDIPDTDDSISQPGGDFESEDGTEVEIGKIASRATPRSFTNVSKMWDSIMLKYLDNGTEKASKMLLHDDASELLIESDISDGVSELTVTNVESTNADLAVSTAITPDTSLAAVSSLEANMKSNSSNRGPDVTTNTAETAMVANPLSLKQNSKVSNENLPRFHSRDFEPSVIQISQPNEISIAMAKLNVISNSYVEGYLKGLRHALGRQAFLDIVDTSPELRKTIDSMLISQRNSTKPVRKSFSGPFLTMNTVNGQLRKHRDPSEGDNCESDGRYEALPTKERPGMEINGDVSKTRPLRVTRAAQVTCDFSAEDIYNQANLVSGIGKGQDCTTLPTDIAKEHLSQNLDDGVLTAVRSSISRNAQLWKTSESITQSSPKPVVPDPEVAKSHDSTIVTPSLQRYFSSLERLNEGQSINYSEVSARFDPLPEWHSPRDGSSDNLAIITEHKYPPLVKHSNHERFEKKRQISVNPCTFSENSVEQLCSNPFLDSSKSKHTPSNHISKEQVITKIFSNASENAKENLLNPNKGRATKTFIKSSKEPVRPSQSKERPSLHTSLPQGLSNLIQSSQEDLSGNFKVYKSYENYLCQLRQSWKDASVFVNERSMDEFLELTASKSNDMSQFMTELRTSLNVKRLANGVDDVSSGGAGDWSVPRNPLAYNEGDDVTPSRTDSGTYVTGLTDKLGNIGVDWTLIHRGLIVDESNRSVDNGLGGVADSDGRSCVVTCPECSTNNRPYVTWCLHCGCVLIGVEPTIRNRRKSKTSNLTINVDPCLKYNQVKFHPLTGEFNETKCQTPDSDSIEISRTIGSGQPEVPDMSAYCRISSKSPRQRAKIDKNQYSFHLSISSSTDNGTSGEVHEIEVFPIGDEQGGIDVRVSGAVPSLDLTGTATDDRVISPDSSDMISVRSYDFVDGSDDSTPRAEPSISRDLTMTLKNTVPERMDASTTPDVHLPETEAREPIVVNPRFASKAMPLLKNTDSASPRTNNNRHLSSALRVTSSAGTRDVSSAGPPDRSKPERASAPRVRSANRNVPLIPKWHSASMDWYVQNKTRTRNNAWSSPKCSARDSLRKSRVRDVTLTDVVPFTEADDITPRDVSHGSANDRLMPPLVDVQSYTQYTWAPHRALYQNREGRFAARAPFSWMLSREKFADLIAESPRVQAGAVSMLLLLPDELLLHILSYLRHSDLVRLTRSCKALHRISHDESLWRHVRVEGRTLTDSHLEDIGSRRPLSLHLVQCRGENVSATGIRSLFRSGPDGVHCQIQDLSISGSSGGALTSDVIMHAVTSRCPNVTHIDVSWTTISDVALTSFRSLSSGLVSLNLSGCQTLTDDSVINVCEKHGKSLEVLELFGCFNISPKSLKSIGHHCNKLITLNLGQCYKVTDQSLQNLSPSLERLLHLDLRGCKQIKDASIRKVVRHCKRLVSLTLANCQGATDLAMVEIATYIHNIKYLDMSGCKLVTDVGVRSLAHNCLMLEYLDLSSTNITHKSVSMLASYCNQRLEIVKWNFCKDLSELSLVKLVRHCRKLREVHLYGCKTVKNIDRILLENPDVKVKMNDPKFSSSLTFS